MVKEIRKQTYATYVILALYVASWAFYVLKRVRATQLISFYQLKNKENVKLKTEAD